MTDLTIARLAKIELQQLRVDACRRALVRAAPRQGWRGLARLLRALADRFDAHPAYVTGLWSEHHSASRGDPYGSGAERYGAAPTTTNMNDWRA